MNKTSRFSPEVRERAVRMVFEHRGEHESQWAAISSIASKIGCTAETLRKWVRQARAGMLARHGQGQPPAGRASAGQAGQNYVGRKPTPP
jgi:transposase-like protein